MLNKIWFWLLVIGTVYGLAKAAYQTATGYSAPLVTAASPAPEATSPSPPDKKPPPTPLQETGKKLTAATTEAAKTAVELCVVMIGIMALWLGMMNIARQAGMVDAVARLMRPISRYVFPDVPPGHPAEGAMLMNISANMLGMGNAATPFGLKAMRELQELNPVKDTASNTMAMFLTINTAGFTLVPFTIIGLRVAAGSANPAAPLAGIILATTVGTIAAVAVNRFLSGLPGYALPVSATKAPEAAAGSEPEERK